MKQIFNPTLFRIFAIKLTIHINKEWSTIVKINTYVSDINDWHSIYKIIYNMDELTMFPQSSCMTVAKNIK